ncbi:MAG: hypothetical protein RLP44_24745 [Aggregatilineales bacterium]
MKKYLILIALLIVLSVTTITAYAITPPTSVTIVGFNDVSRDCGQTPYTWIPEQQTEGMMIYLQVATIQMHEPFDYHSIFIRDRNGVLIGRFRSHSARGHIHHIPINGYELDTGAPTALPWIISIYDHPDNLEEDLEIFIPMGEFVFDPSTINSACERLPYIDTQNIEPINYNVNEIAAYNATDDNGEPALHIYDINTEGDGTLALEITQDIIAPYIDNPPAENTALMTSDNGKVTLYMLDTGELQINSGPDAEGKIHVLIFDAIPPTNIYGYVIDPPLFP